MGNDQQHATAAQMKKVAADNLASFVVNVGDNFYKSKGFLNGVEEEQGGVTSLTDPLWKLYFEDVYNGSLKEMKFLTVLGNHGTFLRLSVAVRSVCLSFCLCWSFLLSMFVCVFLFFFIYFFNKYSACI